MPEDLSVVGFDDIEISAYAGLTTVRQPLFDSGYLGARLLLDALEGGRRLVAAEHHLPLELVERSTTARTAEGAEPVADIVLEDVWKVYADGTEAVRSLDLDIADGEFMVLVGPSGCGKTTALRMVAGLEAISKGTLRIGDRVVNDVPPKDRDIAMVFQNYALYPHMSVYDNMAFGLKLQKVPKHEIDERVREAARILGLDELLDRKPKALSGGQRQRVAMGRAIVRHPQAFLMDEPLSNLDAKLRVQTRAEIARLQSDLGVTTIYVTHDQVEAMTMGDRVAVHAQGRAPAGRHAADALRAPGQPLRRRLHRLAGDEPRRRHASSATATASSCTSPSTASRCPPRCSSARPRLAGFEGRTVVLGIRPEDMEDAALVSDAPADRRIRVDGRPAGGARLRRARPLPDRRAAGDDRGRQGAGVRRRRRGARAGGAAGGGRRVGRRRPAQPAHHGATKGEPIELVVDTHRLHFFDPADGSGIYGN